MPVHMIIWSRTVHVSGAQFTFTQLSRSTPLNRGTNPSSFCVVVPALLRKTQKMTNNNKCKYFIWIIVKSILLYRALEQAYPADLRISFLRGSDRVWMHSWPNPTSRLVPYRHSFSQGLRSWCFLQPAVLH